MGSPYIGELRLFGGNFAPLGWALCNGQLLSISQNASLYQLIGTTYGGDGVNTFGLPNLQGRFPVHQGQGNGLQNYVLGQMAGSETVTLLANQLPAHNHGAVGSNGNATPPANATWGSSTAATNFLWARHFGKRTDERCLHRFYGREPAARQYDALFGYYFHYLAAGNFPLAVASA